MRFPTFPVCDVAFAYSILIYFSVKSTLSGNFRFLVTLKTLPLIYMNGINFKENTTVPSLIFDDNGKKPLRSEVLYEVAGLCPYISSLYDSFVYFSRFYQFPMPLPLRLALLFPADPPLGRLDYDALPDQALMEVIFEGMVDKFKNRVTDKDGDFQDVSRWKNVKCEDERVTQVQCVSCPFSDEPFPFKAIPPLVTRFVIESCNLHGTLDPLHLPESLTFLQLDSNNLHGTINFGSFPQNLQEISLFWNRFSGSCMLGALPDSVVIFDASSNEFSGEISLNDLPPAMEELRVHQNLLSGPIHIKALPSTMRLLNLSLNDFSGDFRLMVPPRSLEEICIVKTKLSATAVLLKESGEMPFDIYHDGLTAVVDENGDKHPWEGQIVGGSESTEEE